MDAKTEIKRLKFMLTSSPAVTYVSKAFGDFAATFISENVSEIIGYQSSDFLDNPSFWADHIHPDDKENIFIGLKDLFEKDYHMHEYRFQHRDGSYRWMRDRMKLIRNANSEPLEIIGSWTDITNQKQIEKKLEESEEQFRSLFENATDIIQVLRPDGQILFVNPSWCKTLGYSKEEAQNLKVFDIIHPECTDQCELNFHKALTEGTTGIVEIVFRGKDGKKLIFEGSANCKYSGEKPSYVHCIFRDMTKQQKMMEQLLNSQKLESLGILAGGLAHDFNNILTVLIGNLSLAKMLASPDDKLFRRLVNAENASLRASKITQQLLIFSKGGKPLKKTTSIRNIVKDSIEFVLAGSNVKCEFKLAADLWLVEADEGQISQVVNNLLINADQAMPEGGTITVSAENVHITSQEFLSLQNGNYVVITVEDHGIGISEKHLGKIFDPYFSTKHNGHGLGLSSAYSIIKNHGGVLVVESDQGKGTVFRFYLPASDNKITEQEVNGKDIHRGKGEILLMDDEENVLEIAKEMLVYLGYGVKTSTDGQQALEIYRKGLQDNIPFDAVILDLTVPGGMGGIKTMEKLLEMDPSAKLIVSSGYANDPIMANYKSLGFSGIVPKPYKINELSKVLMSLLN